MKPFPLARALPRLLPLPFLFLFLASCNLPSQQSSSTGQDKKLHWPGDDLPSDQPTYPATGATTSRTVSSSSYPGGSTTRSRTTTAVPGAGNTTIIIEEPIIYPGAHGYHHPHGYPHGYGHRYPPHTTYPSGHHYRRTPARGTTTILNTTSGRSPAPATRSNVSPGIRPSDVPAYRP